jgi:hypothetical protein
VAANKTCIALTLGSFRVTMKTWAAEEQKFNTESAAGGSRKEFPRCLLQQHRAIDTAIDKLQLGKADIVIWPIFNEYVNFCTLDLSAHLLG